MKYPKSKKNLRNNFIKDYLDRKVFYILTFAVFALTCLQAFTYKPIKNFWYILYDAFGNNLTNTLFFCLLIANIIYFNREMKMDYYLINRMGTYKEKVRQNLEIILLMNTIIFIAFVIMNIGMSIFVTPVNFKIITSDYNIILPLQIIFDIGRFYIYVILISSLVSLILNVENKKISRIFIVIFIIFTMYSPNLSNRIDNLNILTYIYPYTTYLSHIVFPSFTNEVIASVVNIILYLIIDVIVYKKIIEKKVDI